MTSNTETKSFETKGMVSLVPDHYHRYPGDLVLFYVRIAVGTLLAAGGDQEENDSANSTKLTLFLPRSLHLAEFSPMDGPAIEAVSVLDQEDGVLIQWQLNADSQPPQTDLEFITHARVDYPGGRLPGMAVEAPATRQGHRQTVSARLIDQSGFTIASESAQIMIFTQSRLMRYLPEIYQDNEFLGRYLMLFESFWNPIGSQIYNSNVYYDPDLTPEKFLPWLASWIGITWDTSLPERNKRRLLRAALSLFRRRGTRDGLEDFLQIYTSGRASITEHRANNLVLGRDSVMGIGCALGTENHPHTFTVSLSVQRSFITELFRSSQDAQASEHAEKLLLNRLVEIVNLQKPAHTAFRMNLEVLDGEMTAP